jgi:DNA-binding NtrC family response regulator
MLAEGRLLNEREVLDALGGVVRPAVSAPESAAVPAVNPGPEPVMDRSRVEQVLQKFGGNKSAAARELGVSRRAFYRRLESLGLR